MSDEVEVLTRAQCLSRLSRQDVGRVAVSINAMPKIVPVRYLIEGGDLIFRAPLDNTLATSCDEAVIAFEVDEIATAYGGGWSVHVLGVASLSASIGSRPTQCVSSQGPAETGRGQSVQLSLNRISGYESTASARFERTA
jgi:hypothetical protein